MEKFSTPYFSIKLNIDTCQHARIYKLLHPPRKTESYYVSLYQAYGSLPILGERDYVLLQDNPCQTPNRQSSIPVTGFLTTVMRILKRKIDLFKFTQFSQEEDSPIDYGGSHNGVGAIWFLPRKNSEIFEDQGFVEPDTPP